MGVSNSFGWEENTFSAQVHYESYKVILHLKFRLMNVLRGRD
jgi:hypothetical protein